MAFPATTLRLAPTLDRIAFELVTLKSNAAARRSSMAAGDVSSSVILALWESLHQIKIRLQQYAAVPGIGPYAQSQYDDPALDIAAEFNAVIAALNAVINNIATTFPKDAGGFLLAKQFGATAFVDRQFTPAQTVALQGFLADLEATIA